jgi:hypothetical protein
MFITVFITARYRYLSWARYIQSTPPSPISSSRILILSSHLRLRLLSGLFASGFWTRLLKHFLSPNARYMPRPSHPPRSDHSSDIWWRVQQIINLCIMESSSASRYFSPLSSKYTPKHLGMSKMLLKWLSRMVVVYDLVMINLMLTGLYDNLII